MRNWEQQYIDKLNAIGLALGTDISAIGAGMQWNDQVLAKLDAMTTAAGNAGGGGYDSYKAPTVAHADDEEFTVGSDLTDTGFSEQNPSSKITWSIEPLGNGLRAACLPSVAAVQHASAYKAMPAEDEVEMCVAMWIPVASSTVNLTTMGVGLGVYEDAAAADDDLHHCSILGEGSNRGRAFIRNETSWISTGTANYISVEYLWGGEPVWLWCQVKKSTKAVEYYISRGNGRNPERFMSGPFTHAATGALQHWGLHVMNRSNTGAFDVYFRNWRVTRVAASGMIGTLPGAAGGF